MNIFWNTNQLNLLFIYNIHLINVYQPNLMAQAFFCLCFWPPIVVAYDHSFANLKGLNIRGLQIKNKWHSAGHVTLTQWPSWEDIVMYNKNIWCMWQVCEVSAEGQVRYELETRFQQLQSRLASVTLETEEVKSVLCSLFLCTPSEMLIAVLCNFLMLGFSSGFVINPFLILIYCISNLWNSFRSVRHLRPHSQTFWRASVMMTATPPLMPRPPHQWRAQVTAQEPNPASPNAEPINRTARPFTSQ